MQNQMDEKNKHLFEYERSILHTNFMCKQMQGYALAYFLPSSIAMLAYSIYHQLFIFLLALALSLGAWATVAREYQSWKAMKTYIHEMDLKYGFNWNIRRQQDKSKLSERFIDLLKYAAILLAIFSWAFGLWKVL